jgi:hypothetical protein
MSLRPSTMKEHAHIASIKHATLVETTCYTLTVKHPKWCAAIYE